MKKYLTIAAAAVLLASCSGDSEINKAAELSAPVPIQLGTSMQLTATRGNSQAIQSTELEPGQTVGVYIYYKDATTTNTTYSYGYKNLAYTVDDHTVTGGTAGDLSLVTALEQPYYPENKSQNIDIYAFSPRTGVYTSTGELGTLTAQNVFATAADQTSDANYKASDFVWGKAANVANGTSTAIEIPLKHKLSKVNVNIAPGTGMTLAKLDKAKITLNGVVLDGTVNFTTGSVTPRSGSAASSVILTSGVDQTVTTSFNDASSNSHTACSSSAVIIPQTIAASTSFITIQLWDAAANSGAGAYTSTYNVTTSAASTFAAETVYTYNIIVNTQGLTLTTTIADWTPAGSVVNGTAE